MSHEGIGCHRTVAIQTSGVSVSFVGHTGHCETESEHQGLNGKLYIHFLLRILVLFGTKFQYS